MADGKTFEYGSSASEVQFQDEVGKVKNRQGEACIEITDDQNVGIGTATPRRRTARNGMERRGMRLSLLYKGQEEAGFKEKRDP